MCPHVTDRETEAPDAASLVAHYSPWDAASCLSLGLRICKVGAITAPSIQGCPRGFSSQQPSTPADAQSMFPISWAGHTGAPRTSHSTTSTQPPSPTTGVGSLAEARSAQACLRTTTTAADSSSHCFVSWTWPPQTPSSPFLKLFLILAEPGPISSPPPWGPRGQSVGWAASDSSLPGGSHSLPPHSNGGRGSRARGSSPSFPWNGFCPSLFP